MESRVDGHWVDITLRLQEDVVESIVSQKKHLPTNVEDGILYDAAVTDSLDVLGMSGAFVGRRPNKKLASETLDRITDLGDIHSDKNEVTVTVQLPVGKHNIIRQLSRRCSDPTYPSETAVMSAFLRLALDTEAEVQTQTH